MTYIYTLLEEKNIDLEDTIEFENQNGLNIMPIGVVIETVAQMGKENIEKVQNTLRMIDFKNGNILDFITHIGKGIA